MALTKSPTRTLTIERSWLREVRRRFKSLKRALVDELQSPTVRLQLNQDGFEFDFTASQIRVYMSFLEQQIQNTILVTDQGPNWQAIYQQQSYQRALEATRSQLISQGASIVKTQEEILIGQGMKPLTATPSLATSPLLSQPLHADALEFLFTRSYDSLKGWTDALTRETRQILVDGVEQGLGIREVTRNMVERIDVTRSRAELIARTETIQAYQRGATNEGKRLEVELDEPVMMRWISARDSRVRHQHAAWHGTLATPEENMARIGKSPWNCRCAQVATLEDFITPKKEAKFKKEREALMTISTG